MPTAKDFFEISIDKLPVSSNLDYEKYTPEQYLKMGISLGKVQNLMDQGLTGKEILAQDNSNDLYGISALLSLSEDPKSHKFLKLFSV